MDWFKNAGKIIWEKDEVAEKLNEMLITYNDDIPLSLERSAYYPKLESINYKSIFRFLKEQTDLREDLIKLNSTIGEAASEYELIEFFNNLTEKYNRIDNNVGIAWHIEETRIDIGVPVFVIIKRDAVYVRKFVFRYRKAPGSTNLFRDLGVKF